MVHPAPLDVQSRWRATGAWTDETLLDRLDAAPGDRLAIIDDDARYDVADLRAVADAYAARLQDLGVIASDIVCWQLPNWWEAIALCWGIWRVGAISSPITPTLGARELCFILRQTNARAVVVPRDFRDTDYVTNARATDFAGEVLVLKRGEHLLARAPTPSPVVDVDDPAVVLWTSGTTAEPKGVVHTHQSLRHEADSIAAAHTISAGERLLLPMPITHVAGLTYGVLLPVTAGITTVLMDTWEPRRALELIERERIAVMISTPVFMRTMIDHPHFMHTDTSSIRLFSLGGAGVAPAMVREGQMRFDCWCKRTYGSTEYPTLTTGRAGDDPERDATTDGPLIGQSELRIVDPHTLHDLNPGDPGELLVRGPEMLRGYLDGMLDADAFVNDGWFRTGDLATFDGEYLTIVDRLKDVIIRGGENISAQEVEALLVTHPAVADAACVARPDPIMGERVCAFVIARGDLPVTLAELRAHLLAAGLARFKLPEHLELRADLPRTASGKVQKAGLRAMLDAR
ncbi:MAG: class I adenylate-forming enzyme family protein [Actinomycetota bacterium]